MRFASAILVCAGLLVLLLPTRVQADPPSPALVQLTHDGAVDIRPAWSPDNRAIAFQSNRSSSVFHIGVMNADGSNERMVTQGTGDDRHPAWMPDGKTILFDSSDGKQSEIWSVSVADGSRKQITHLGAFASFPSASPDGKQIAFYVFKDEVLDLWTAQVDGSDAKPVTHDLASANNNQCTFACHQAAWSPDSRTLAYSTGELDSIWTVSGDGSNPTEVISNGEQNHFPWFTTDGRLGYITEHITPGQAWTDAWIYDLKQGQTKPLQEKMALQGPLEWSADDKKVLFHSPRSGNFEIYLVDLTAPDGIPALQGTPLAAQNISSAATPAAASTPASGPARATDSDPLLPVIGLGVLALLAFAGVGVAAVKKL